MTRPESRPLSPTWEGLPPEPVATDVHGLRTSWRTQSAGATLRRLWPALRQLGVTRVSDLTELDRLDVPVLSAVRPSVDDAQITKAKAEIANIDLPKNNRRCPQDRLSG